MLRNFSDSFYNHARLLWRRSLKLVHHQLFVNPFQIFSFFFFDWLDHICRYLPCLSLAAIFPHSFCLIWTVTLAEWANAVISYHGDGRSYGVAVETERLLITTHSSPPLSPESAISIKTLTHKCTNVPNQQIQIKNPLNMLLCQFGGCQDYRCDRCWGNTILGEIVAFLHSRAWCEVMN